MKNLNKNAKLVFMSMLSVVMTAFTLFLGAPFLRVFRSSVNSFVYWLFCSGLALVFWSIEKQSLAILMLTASVAIGVFFEAEKLNLGLFKAGVLSVASGIFSTFLGVYAWQWQDPKFSITQQLNKALEVFVQQSQQVGNPLPIDSKALLAQLPSALISVLIITIAVSLIYERIVAKWFTVETGHRNNLLQFHLPDYFIWILLSSFLFSFLKIQHEEVNIVATNIFNVCVVLYFFHGLAVLESFFITVRMNRFVRIISYFLLITQFFFVLSILGVIDFWVDFRSRLSRTSKVG